MGRQVFGLIIGVYTKDSVMLQDQNYVFLSENYNFSSNLTHLYVCPTQKRSTDLMGTYLTNLYVGCFYNESIPSEKS